MTHKTERRRNAEDLKLWKLLSRAPISKWTKGKVIIIGDAAHPMLPSSYSFLSEILFDRSVSRTMANTQSCFSTDQAQGGNQAIEDAGALGVCLSGIKSLGDIPCRLELVQNIRRERAAAIQIFSNAGQDQSHRIEKEAQKYVKGPVPSKSASLLQKKKKKKNLFPIFKMLRHETDQATENRGEFHQWNFGYDVLSVSVEAMTAFVSSELGNPF